VTTLYLARRFCRHGNHDWPTDDFRALPIDKQKRIRLVCSRCYEKIMAEREKKKAEGFRA
jgi:hypothetical protein